MHEIISHTNFERWLGSFLGSYLADLESRWFFKVLSGQSAKEIVVLGSLDAIIHTSIDALTYNNHFTVIKTSINDKGGLLANYQAIPLLNESIDIVIMPHIVDSYSSPIDILREAYRILKPEGKLYLSCFNKLSLWGFYQSFAKFFTATPWQSNFVTFLQLEDWLGELGFDIISSKSVGYYLPLNFKKVIALQALIDKISPNVSLPFGAVNLLEVHKRVITLTLQPPLIGAKLIKEFGVNG